MDPLDGNPFGLLTFLVAPAILTNASAIIALSTSNRFGLALERAKMILAEIKAVHAATDYEMPTRIKHLQLAERRVLLLIRALTLVYLAVGSFAAATLVSLLGAAFFDTHDALVRRLSSGLGMLSGTAGVCGLIAGCGILLWETRLAQQLLLEESTFQLRRVQIGQLTVSKEATT